MCVVNKNNMPGNNIGLNDSLQYFEIEFDSLDTNTTPDGASKTTDWPLFLLGRPLTNVAAIKILEVQIPFSWYVYNSTNNTFVLSESDSLSTSPTITIPIGNYTSTSMSATLAALLTAASPASHTYTVTYSGSSNIAAATGKFTISSNAGSTNTFSLTFGSSISPGNTNPRLWLGFNPGANSSNASQILVAPNVASVTGPNYLYVNSNKMGQLCNLYLPQGAYNLGKGTNSPQMAKIPVDVQPGGVVYWKDPDPQKWFDFENLSNFANIDFYLTMGNTSAQTPLQLNGLSFSIKLGVLVNKMVHNDVMGGMSHNERVYARARPR